MKLSIITINYNNCEGLRRTIESVVNQTCRDFEYIIIDGGSTDGSVDVIKQYADQIDYWVSEPDKGIYNAMNKGVAVAKGEYCMFMNSGDTLYTNDVIEELFKKADFEKDIIEGDCFFKGRVMKLPDSISGIFLFKNALCHQASVIKTNLLKEEPYLENFKIASDWIFFFNILIFQNSTYQHVDIIVCDFDCTGISVTNKDLGYIERHQWLRQTLPRRIYEDYLLLSGYEDHKVARALRLELAGIAENTLFEKMVLIFVKFLKQMYKLKKFLLNH